VHIIVLYCITLGPQPVGVQCSITSSLGEFPGYWDWPKYYWLSSVLVFIASPFAFHISVFFHSLFTCNWISCGCIFIYSVDPSLTRFLGEFPNLGLALVPDVVVPEAEHGVRVKQKPRFKFLSWLGFEPRILQSNGRESYH